MIRDTPRDRLHASEKIWNMFFGSKAGVLFRKTAGFPPFAAGVFAGRFRPVWLRLSPLFRGTLPYWIPNGGLPVLPGPQGSWLPRYRAAK